MKEIEGEDRGRMMKDALVSVDEGCTRFNRRRKHSSLEDEG